MLQLYLHQLEQVVVLGPGGPEFYYEAIGHGLEGDFNRKISVFTELNELLCCQ